MKVTFLDNKDKEEMQENLDEVEGRVQSLEGVKPLVLYAEKASEYVNNAVIGDEALEAILTNRQVLVRVPNADGGRFTAVYSPIALYQLPNYQNKYLYLFFLNDSADGNITYGQLKLLLSKTYNETPLS